MKTPEQFMQYFRTNYPGPSTMIANPDWHAPKIYRAAIDASGHRELLDVVKQFDALVRKLEGTEIEYSLAIALSEVLVNAHEAVIKAVGVEAAMDWIDSTGRR